MIRTIGNAVLGAIAMGVAMPVIALLFFIGAREAAEEERARETHDPYLRSLLEQIARERAEGRPPC